MAEAQSTQVVEQTQPVEVPKENITYEQPKQEQPVQQTVPQVNASSAAEEIASKESGGSYTATNGRYYGKYQLDQAYLNGDLSPENQEATFQRYCQERYGSVEAALEFRQRNGYY